MIEHLFYCYNYEQQFDASEIKQHVMEVHGLDGERLKHGTKRSVSFMDGSNWYEHHFEWEIAMRPDEPLKLHEGVAGSRKRYG